MNRITFTSDEIGQLMSLVAFDADRWLADPNINNESKAAVLKAKSTVTITKDITPNGGWNAEVRGFAIVKSP